MNKLVPLPDPPGPADAPQLVAGIGASAGGLAALQSLLGHLPKDHTAVIVVQHLAPDTHSALPELLARVANLNVEVARDGAVLRANVVYVAPPNAELKVADGRLRLTTWTQRPKRTNPIDRLFCSLATAYGACAIGIVLSGTGKDGTEGLRCIKRENGLTFAQCLDTAQYDGMPRNALASGVSDFCMSPEKIAEEVTEIAHGIKNRERVLSPKDQIISPFLQKIFDLLKHHFDTDLSEYKLATILRRVERRMGICKEVSAAGYLKYLSASSAELHALHYDILIAVTSFLRNPASFLALQKKTFSALFEYSAATRSPIRVWVVGCATGEEAYSLAIMFARAAETRKHKQKIQIFATDTSEPPIAFARAGLYPESAAKNLPKGYLDEYFTRSGTSYQICRDIRNMVLFSRHDINRDAPFSRIDLVTCRNLLIYLRMAAQSRAIQTFHYALRNSGYLMLGNSETVRDLPGLFESIDNAHKIYVRKSATRVRRIQLELGIPKQGARRETMTGGAAALETVNALVDKAILEWGTPAGLIVDKKLDIVGFRGAVGPFLAPASGPPSFHLYRLTHPGLHMALRQVVKGNFEGMLPRQATTALSLANMRINVQVQSLPLQKADKSVPWLLLLLHQSVAATDSPNSEAAPVGDASTSFGHTQALADELSLAKQYLQSAIEDQDGVNLELKLANEELSASNEELQKSNEELEMSKEEMQSSNEELTTVNEELNNRMLELMQTSDDLHNVFALAPCPIVLIGVDQRIRKFSPVAARLFNLIETDTGRDLRVISAFFSEDIIAKAVRAAIFVFTTFDEILRCQNGDWYRVVVSPYRTLEHTIGGAVINLTEVDLLHRLHLLNQDIPHAMDNLLCGVGEAMVLLDENLRAIWANAPFWRHFKLPKVTIDSGKPPLFSVFQFVDQRLQSLLENALAKNQPFDNYRLTFACPDSQQSKSFMLSTGRLPWPTPAPMLLLNFRTVQK